MRILDSSFLVSMFVEDDAHHSKALAILDTDPDETWILPDLILFEFLTVIRYNKGVQAARAAYGDLMANKHVQLRHFEPGEQTAILDLFFSSPLSISTADAAVAYLCKTLGSPALSFDDNLLKVIARQSIRA
ncbi:MAG: PIN domain-containing protein [Candidatus Micrarchaeota archaeon]